MRRAWAIAVLLTGLTWAGCRFSGPSPATGGDDGGPADAAPDADAPDSNAPACMRDTSYSNNDGHRYKLYAQNMNYDAAIDHCAADGAHLAVVDSMEENEYLRSLITSDVWIGLDDLTVEGIPQWVTGATSTFRSFNTSEPNNLGGEDCMIMRTDGKWDDNGCESGRRVLCECDPAYRPPPTPPCRTLPGSMTRSGRRYFARTTPSTWQAAEDDCKTIGAHLLVIGDVDENTDLDMAFNGNAYWIGYTDAVDEGQFKWVDGSPSAYQRFGASVPNNDAEECAVLQDGGTWDDQACDAMYPYACECDPAPP